MPEAAVSNMPVPEDVRDLVKQYLKSRNQENFEKNLQELLDVDGGCVERFNFFVPRLDENAKESMLISGCAAGSEFFVAKRFGFGKVVGTEVAADLVEICERRLANDSDCRVNLIDGLKLPYRDAEFSTVYSGHVIEHTPNTFEYFKEHWRVLRPGGFFFLEFPNRYHHTELHTGLPSYEWLPKPIRNVCLRMLATPLLTKDKRKRDLYDAVRTTLNPMSVRQILSYLRKVGLPTSRVVALEIPAPGFMRALVRK